MTTANTPVFVQEVLGQRITLEVDMTSTTGTPITNATTYTVATLLNDTRSLDYSTTNEAEEIVDLANIDFAAATVRHVRATDFKVSGQGLVHKPDLLEWVQWAQSGVAKNCRVTVDDIYTQIGPFALTGFSLAGARQKGIVANITIEQAAPTIANAIA